LGKRIVLWEKMKGEKTKDKKEVEEDE